MGLSGGKKSSSGGNLVLFEIQPESLRDRQQEERARDSTFRFCYKYARGGVWQERRAWQRVDLEKAQCPGRSFGARKTDVISPLEQGQLWRDTKDTASS